MTLSDAKTSWREQQGAESLAVEFRDVSKTYAGSSEPAISSVSFSVRRGEMLVLLGPSGCGKSTSLRVIAGLETPDTGDISLSGRLVSSSARRLFIPPEKRNIGMVFQSYAIWPHMSVVDNVAYPLRMRRVPRRLARQRAEQALELVGLKDATGRSATKMSGGQQQRVALARALICEPTLLLLDEPLSNLDAQLRVRMRAELRDLQRKTGVTAVFVTHDQAESMALADRIIVMNNGNIEQVGTPTDIYERPASLFVAEFIGSINRLNATVLSYDPNTSLARVRLSSSRQEIYASAAASADLAPGAAAYALIRPEHLTLDRGPASPASAEGTGYYSWPAKVRNVTYHGDHREYQVDGTDPSLDLSLTAYSSTTVNFAPGETIYVSCRSAHLTLAPVRVE